MHPLSSGVLVGLLTMKTSQYWAPVHQSSHLFLIVKMMMDFLALLWYFHRSQVRSLPCLVTESVALLIFVQIVGFIKVVSSLTHLLLI